MLGAIAGDIIGSVYEFNNVKSKHFPLFLGGFNHFTDDTVLTCAIASSVLGNGDYLCNIRNYFDVYRNVGYGPMFRKWAESDEVEPYGSFGNGSAMRVSPIGFAFDSLESVLAESRKSAEVTHNTLEGIKGAQAIAVAVYLAKRGNPKDGITDYISRAFDYDLSRSLNKIRPEYKFDATCAGSVPQAIRAFLESTDFESAIRGAISIGGDSDTIACMAGGIAEAFYGGVPDDIATKVYGYLDDHLTSVVKDFEEVYGHGVHSV